MNAQKIILITGVTGTLGNALLRKILDETKHFVVGISRDEQKQRLLPKHNRAIYKLADVRDIDSISRAVWPHNIDVVFHLAALKCVDTLEENRLEAIKTNVWGTHNICDFFRGQARVILASTDKACYPINTYGMTKALAEKIVTAEKGSAVVRYGNVIGSRGSLLPALIKSLKTERMAYLTDSAMTRFWIPIDIAKNFVFEVGMCPIMTGIITPKDIKSAYVSQLIEAVANILKIKNYDVEDISIRAGEKIDETLSTKYETENGKDICSNNNNLLMTKQELETMLLPLILSQP